MKKPPSAKDKPVIMLITAFLNGAKFWEFHKTNATMWASDQKLVVAEAINRYVTEELPHEFSPKETAALEQAIRALSQDSFIEGLDGSIPEQELPHNVIIKMLAKATKSQEIDTP
jgi:hypothetical protein